MPNSDFELKDKSVEVVDETISDEDFKFVDANSISHEQKFQTKPTTFFKDSIKRFMKNKSSVVAACILGILLIMAAIVPVVDPYPVKSENASYMTYLEPKLFNKGGFWDGTKKWKDIPTYIPKDSQGNFDSNKDNWWPNPKKFEKNAVSNKQFSELTYTDGASEYGYGGYTLFGYSHKTEEGSTIFYRPSTFKNKITLDDTIYLKTFETYDEAKLKAKENNKKGAELPSNYELGEVELYFTYKTGSGKEEKTHEYKLLDRETVFNVGSTDEKVNLTEKLQEELNKAEDTNTEFSKSTIEIRLVNEGERKNTCALIGAVEFEVESSNAALKKEIEAANYTDATNSILQKTTDEKGNANPACWESNAKRMLHLSNVVYCTFRYDSYEAKFGDIEDLAFDEQKIKNYKKAKWMEFDILSFNGGFDPTGYPTYDFKFKVLDETHCPIKEIKVVSSPDGGNTYFIDAVVCRYKLYGYEKMPKFLMGTDKDGNVMFRYVFEGLGTSLLLGIGTFIVCFLFGLLWGSVCGYFGGTVDLLMERFTDILSGVPWIVVMTLAIIKFGSNIWTFALALCLTGWIGTAATTRTQFYRFRSREYVLASRTLGANDARLIAKHILPNAMGTIITSAVLMIPSVIFSEASISYLGLGLKDQSSLGVILSNNQGELTSSPYLLIFPSVIIALLMISFNLFGNGLRDAVNPSLKGED